MSSPSGPDTGNPPPGPPKAGFSALIATAVVIGFAIVWKWLPRRRVA